MVYIWYHYRHTEYSIGRISTSSCVDILHNFMSLLKGVVFSLPTLHTFFIAFETRGFFKYYYAFEVPRLDPLSPAPQLRTPLASGQLLSCSTSQTNMCGGIVNLLANKRLVIDGVLQ